MQMMQNTAAGAQQGIITTESIANPAEAADTVRTLNPSTFNENGVLVNTGFGPANILVNVNPVAPFVAGYNGFQNLTDQENQTLTILHELGHAIVDNGGISGVVPDGPDNGDPTGAVSIQNSENVVSHCLS
jgi:hypothetical protein